MLLHPGSSKFLAITACLIFFGGMSATADTVVMKRDSRPIEGVILQETESSLTIQTNTSSFEIKKSDIKEIIRSTAASDEERQADRLMREGDFRRAAELYAQAAAKMPEKADLAEKLESARQQVVLLQQKENDRLLKDVRSAENAKRYDIAIQRLRAILASTQDEGLKRQLVRQLAHDHYQHAQVLIDAVRFDLAQRELLEAIKVDPSYRVAYLELADLVRADAARAGEALQMYEKGFLLNDPSLTVEDESRYRFHFAELLYRAGQYEKALENFNFVMSKSPRSYPAVMNYVVDVNTKLGETMKGKDVEEGIRALKAAIEQDQRALPARFLLGNIYYENRQYDQSIEALTALLEYEPAYPKANYMLAQAHREKGDLENYRAFLVREIAVNPGSYDPYCELAEHLLDGAEYQEALNLFERAIKVNEALSRAHYGRAESLRRLKRVEEAEQVARALTERDPKNPEAQMVLGMTLADQSRLPEADEALLKSISYFQEKSDLTARDKRLLGQAYFHLGEVALKAKSSNKAYENFLKSVELNPRNPAAYHGMASALVDARRLPEAEDAYINAIQQKPDEAEYYLGLGILYHTHYSRPQDALPFYLKYVELGGEDLANAERWITQCGGKIGDKAVIDVAGLAEKVRQRREREALTMQRDGSTTGTLPGSLPVASMPSAP